MVQNVSFNNSYYVRDCMGNSDISAPAYEKYVVKKNDILWNIAKDKLGKGAKNQEILDYMLEIARFNKLDTKEKRNNLKINQELYIPEPAKKNSNPFNPDMDTKLKAASVQKAEKKSVVKPAKIDEPEPKTKPDEQKTSAETSFDNRINTVLKDPNVYIRKADTSPVNGLQLYHICSNEKNFGEHYIMSCNIDEKGNIKNILYSDDNHFNYSASDYYVSTSDNVVRGNGIYKSKTYGKLNQSDIKTLENKVQELQAKHQGF